MNPYIGNTPEQTKAMLDELKCDSIEDLFEDIQDRHKPRSFNLPSGMTEWDVMEKIRRLARDNSSDLCLFLGGGYYDHVIPSAVDALSSRGEFFTAYTPYQPECSQGTLQALYEFQSVISALTGMDVANASLYDGGTAMYEAMMMALRITGRRRVIMDGGVNPIFRTMIRSYTANLDIGFEETPVVHGRSHRESIFSAMNDQTAAVILQNPNFFGAVDDFSDISREASRRGILTLISVYPVALGLLKTPAEMGADIVTGEGQSLGLPLNFGGPYLGFMAAKKEMIRKMPGRIVGRTVDRWGRRAFVNTLQAREQHIRREKATSNICTNVTLCALRALIYCSLIGRQGLVSVARLNHHRAETAKARFAQIPGVEVKRSSPTFNEFTVALPVPADQVIAAMVKRGFAAGFPCGRYYPDMKNYMIVAVTEKRTEDEIERYAQALEEVLSDLKASPKSVGASKAG